MFKTTRFIVLFILFFSIFLFPQKIFAAEICNGPLPGACPDSQCQSAGGVCRDDSYLGAFAGHKCCAQQASLFPPREYGACSAPATGACPDDVCSSNGGICKTANIGGVFAGHQCCAKAAPPTPVPATSTPEPKPYGYCDTVADCNRDFGEDPCYIRSCSNNRCGGSYASAQKQCGSLSGNNLYCDGGGHCARFTPRTRGLGQICGISEDCQAGLYCPEETGVCSRAKPPPSCEGECNFWDGFACVSRDSTSICGAQLGGVCRGGACVIDSQPTPTPGSSRQPTPTSGGGGGSRPQPTPTVGDESGGSGGREAEPTEPSDTDITCSAPQELSNDEPVVIENYPEWSTVTLHWVGDASSYEIRASDNDETSTAVVSPAGTNNCGDGHSEDLCMTNWRSNRITVRARSGKSYIWSVKAIGSCTSDEASGSFSTASGRGSDNTLPILTPPGGGGAVGSTGQCPDGSGAYTCTYSETDGQCYGGTEGTGHNQAGCNWKCGPVTCPTSGGGSAPALPPGGTVPGLPGRGAPPGGGGSVQPTVDPLNNQCRKTEVTFKLEQDGTNLNLTVRPKSQPEEGMTEYTDEFTIGSERLDSSKCEAYFKKQDGSYYRECKGVVRPQDAGKQVVWTHSWKKGCVSSGGRIVCSGPPCSESTNRTMEDISCEKNKVRLDVQVNKATNKITYKIVSSDSSEGTNEIHDIRPIKPYIETSCNGITSGLYLPLPVGPGLGEVCTLKTNPAGTYTWIHEWTKARGSRGDNRNPARCSSDPLTYQITSDGTVINNPTPAPAGSGSPTAAPALPTLTPTPLPTCSPTSELNNKAGQQAAEIIITPTCRQP